MKRICIKLFFAILIIILSTSFYNKTYAIDCYYDDLFVWFCSLPGSPLPSDETAHTWGEAKVYKDTLAVDRPQFTKLEEIDDEKAREIFRKVMAGGLGNTITLSKDEFMYLLNSETGEWLEDPNLDFTGR